MDKKKLNKDVIHYLIGDRPAKVIYVDGTPEMAKAVDFEKKSFVYDIRLIQRINDSMDVKKISEAEYRNACLAVGVKPE